MTYEMCVVPGCNGFYEAGEGMKKHIKNARSALSNSGEPTSLALAHREYLDNLLSNRKRVKAKKRQVETVQYLAKIRDLKENEVEDIRDDSPFNEDIPDYQSVI